MSPVCQQDFFYYKSLNIFLPLRTCVILSWRNLFIRDVFPTSLSPIRVTLKSIRFMVVFVCSLLQVHIFTGRGLGRDCGSADRPGYWVLSVENLRVRLSEVCKLYSELGPGRVYSGLLRSRPFTHKIYSAGRSIDNYISFTPFLWSMQVQV